MGVMFVSIEQASDHLRRDTTDDDADLELKVEAASQAVINYIGLEQISEFVDFNSDGEIDFNSDDEAVGVPSPIQSATLIILGMLYSDRDGRDFYNDGQQFDRLGKIVLPRTVHFLLDPYRVPRVK